MDFVSTYGGPVLYLADEATRFSAAAFISFVITESVQETILKLWTNVYTGILNKQVFDEGSRFRDAFVEIWEVHYVEWKKSGA